MRMTRSAKSGSSWRSTDLDAYKIVVTIKDEKSFFDGRVGDVRLSIDQNIQDFDTDKEDTLLLPKSSKRLLDCLDLADRSRYESDVDNFAIELLRILDYDAGSRMVVPRRIIPLYMCGDDVFAQTDVCVIRKKSQILLLLQEDKSFTNNKDPEPQVIAEAIAAFQENNKIRRIYNLEPLDKMTFPCITMVGTRPRFYIIPITKELNHNIINGLCPETNTVVFSHAPKVPRMSDGMKPVENRKKILQCFEAFKKFVDELEKLLETE